MSSPIQIISFSSKGFIIVIQDWLKSPQTLIGWSTAIVVVYSITNQSSFDFAKYILQKLDVSKRLDPGCVMLIGNKQDLEHLRKVPRRNLKHLASLYGVLYQETSAANDVASVEKAFKRLLFETVSAQLLKMQTLKLSLEALEEFENTCRPLRLRRRSSNDALRQLSISGSDDNEENEEKNYDENAAQYSATTSNQRRRIIQIAAFLEKIGRSHQLSKN